MGEIILVLKKTEDKRVNKHEITSLAFKILGIYLVIQGFSVMLNVLAVSITAPAFIETGNVAKIIVPYVFPIVFGILLWVFPNRFTVSKGKEESLSKDGFVINANDVERIIFSGLGLLFIGNSLPKLSTALLNIYIMADTPNTLIRLLPTTVGAIIQLVIGVGILLGSQGLVNLLNIIRNAGMMKK